MFYANFVLAKKGPLAKVWLAAHWDKKITKAMVYETSITQSVEAIIKPQVKLALRTSGHLLLGVVRIYSRKAKYLLEDCKEAFMKIKIAFRPGVVDLPEDNLVAAVSAITLPETFHDFDAIAALELNPGDLAVGKYALNQSRPEDITLREDFNVLAAPNFLADQPDDLGPITEFDEFGSLEAGRDGSIFRPHMEPRASGSLFHPPPPPQSTPGALPPVAPTSATDKRDIGMGAPMSAVDDLLPRGGPEDVGLRHQFGDEDHGLFGENFEVDLFGVGQDQPMPEVSNVKEVRPEEGSRTAAAAGAAAAASDVLGRTTLIQPGDTEAFALEPLDVTSVVGHERRKRKRKLIVDEQRTIPSEAMKSQLQDTSDIVTTLDLAPPTRKLMKWKETGMVDKLFTLPTCHQISNWAHKTYQKQTVSRPSSHIDFDNELAPDILPSESPSSKAASAASKATSTATDGNAFKVPALPPGHAPPPTSTEAPLVGETSADLLPSLHLSDLEPHDINEEVPAPLPDDQLHPAYDQDHMQQPPDFAEAGGQIETDQDQDLTDDDEEAEARRWNKRTRELGRRLKEVVFKKKDTASFSQLPHTHNRKQVAATFYAALMLRKAEVILLEQDAPYHDITVRKGPKFRERVGA